MFKERVSNLLEWFVMCIVAIVIALLIKHFVFSVTLVQGDSMNPTLHTDDRLIVNRIGFMVDKIQYGDIVEIHAPDDPGKDYIKRVIALPSDTVEIRDHNVYVNGEKISEDYISTDETLLSTDKNSWVLMEDEYFVLGDNRLPGASKDSRVFGPIRRELIVGIAVFRFWPFDGFGTV